MITHTEDHMSNITSQQPTSTRTRYASHSLPLLILDVWISRLPATVTKAQRTDLRFKALARFEAYPHMPAICYALQAQLQGH